MQAILFRNGKAVGKLVSPELRIESLRSTTATDQPPPIDAPPHAADTGPGRSARISQALRSHHNSAGSSIQMVQLAFGMWQPVAGQKAAVAPTSLHIPVDSKFTDADFRIQVAALRRGP